MSTDAQAVIDLATRAAAPELIEPGQVYAFRTDDDVQLVDPITWADRPRRKTGRFTILDEDAFVRYIARHGGADTEVWANAPTSTITAVLDGNGAEPGWGEHRATLQLRHTPAWLAWAANDKKMLPQLDFAEHVESRIIDFVEPEGAVMVELAQSFQASSKGRFESSRRLGSGQTTLEWRENVEAKAGQKGQLTIPDSFTLALAPYVYGPPYKVTARLRYRINDGDLRLGYVLDRPEELLLDAFSAVVDRVDEATEPPLFAGTPA